MPLRALLALCLSVLLLTGATACGQKGALYLPDSTDSEASR